CMQGIEALLTF
nr:immunoglobulin light chain junction region [Macaca mulatta]